MKKNLALILAFISLANICEARVINESSSSNPAIRLAESDMKFCDKDQDGFLTLEEYKLRANRRLTVNDKKSVKIAKRKGYYKTDEERFAEMDKTGEGKITLRDLEAYYTSQREQNELMY